MKKIVNFNLSNHKEATDRLRLQLKDSEFRIAQKDEENKQLHSKLTFIKVQIAKLEKAQLKEMSRSRSGSRKDQDTFRFGSTHRLNLHGTIDEREDLNNLQDRSNEKGGSIDSGRRFGKPKNMLNKGFSFMQKSLQDLRALKNNSCEGFAKPPHVRVSSANGLNESRLFEQP